MSLFAAALLLQRVSGAVKQFTLDLSHIPVSPDGSESMAYLANGIMEYPMVVDKGDDLEVTVNNHLDVGTAVHYHGMFQNGTTFYDGSAGISQCPIPPGSSMTYKFSTGQQHGTFWWHAHYKAQYTKGIRGPLIIRDPDNEPYTHEYDEEKIVMLTDWFHADTSAEILDPFLASSTGNEPIPNSGLINGKGRYDCSLTSRKCTPNAPLETFDFVPGRRYRLRIINAASMATFNFSIDGHKLDVIEADGIDTQKTTVDFIRISVAQRYSVIVTANAPATSNYWMRADIDTSIYTVYDPNVMDPHIRAVIAYPNITGEPTSEPNAKAVGLDIYNLLPYENLPAPPDVDVSLTLMFTIIALGDNVSRAYTMVDGYFDYRPFSTPKGSSLLMDIIKGKNLTDSPANIINIKRHQVVQLRIYNDDPMEHTFHLHGHTFWVMSKGVQLNAPVNPDAPILKPVRDTIAVPPCKVKRSSGGEEGICGGSKGFVDIRFVADNPGVWLMHCHIEWHMAQGLAMTFVEAEDDLKKMALPADVMNACQSIN